MTQRLSTKVQASCVAATEKLALPSGPGYRRAMANRRWNPASVTGSLAAAVLLIGAAGPASADGSTSTASVGAGNGEPRELKGALGVGLIVGEPTGISVRLYIKDDQAIQAAVGEAFVSGGLQVHADYVWHPWILDRREDFDLVGYIGPGMRLIDYSGTATAKDHIALGLRAVAGMVFDFKNVPLDAFLEVAGVGEYDFGAGQGFDLGINAGAGVRSYF